MPFRSILPAVGLLLLACSNTSGIKGTPGTLHLVNATAFTVHPQVASYPSGGVWDTTLISPNTAACVGLGLDSEYQAAMTVDTSVAGRETLRPVFFYPTAAEPSVALQMSFVDTAGQVAQVADSNAASGCVLP